MAGPVVGVPFTTTVGEVYLPLGKHRGRATSQRSVWTKPVPTEVACFVQAWGASWGERDGELWGHRSATGVLEPVGRNNHGEDLWFGKFLRAERISPWHGYPADYRRKTQDRPPPEVLNRWRALGVLAKHQVAKVAAGRPCKL